MKIINIELGDTWTIESGADEIQITITDVSSKAIRIGIDAPESIEILREEIANPSVEPDLPENAFPFYPGDNRFRK
jgi:carbon storage regulator CsrA